MQKLQTINLFIFTSLIFISLTVNIIFQIKVFGEGPVSKLLEQNHPSSVGVNGIKLRLHVLIFLSCPFLYQRLEILITELPLGQPHVSLRVYGVEALIELKGGPECLQ